MPTCTPEHLWGRDSAGRAGGNPAQYLANRPGRKANDCTCAMLCVLPTTHVFRDHRYAAEPIRLTWLPHDPPVAFGNLGNEFRDGAGRLPGGSTAPR